MQARHFAIGLAFVGLTCAACGNNAGSNPVAQNMQPVPPATANQVAAPTTPAPAPVAAPAAVPPPAPAPAARASYPESANISSASPGEKPGLVIARGSVSYNDGDILSGDFRIYCPTQMIRPTNYVLKTASGAVKKQGSWWSKAFTPKWGGERTLVQEACR